MPRRQILTDQDRKSLLAIPQNEKDFELLYSFSSLDIFLINQNSRGAFNKINLGVQLCYLRYPGMILPKGENPSPAIFQFVCDQLGLNVKSIELDQKVQPITRREHIKLLRSIFEYKQFTGSDYKIALKNLGNEALKTDKGITLMGILIEGLRRKKVIIPPIETLERLCAQAITNAERTIYNTLTAPLTENQKIMLDGLLQLKEHERISVLTWLRQHPPASNPRHILEHLERLSVIDELGLPENLEKQIHQNRLLKMAREGGQMTLYHLTKFESSRRYATLMAVLLETRATLIDELIDMHDKIIVSFFSKAKNLHEAQFQRSGKEINDKVRLFAEVGTILLESKITGEDPITKIESILSWDDFTESVSQAKLLIQPQSFDFLHLLGNSYPTLRRYTPALLEFLKLEAAPVATQLLEAVNLIKKLNSENLRKVPETAPISFIKKRWQNLIFTDSGIDRKFYELCLFSELKNALRSGDIWVKGSRQFKDFEEYLIPKTSLEELQKDNIIRGILFNDPRTYLEGRIAVLTQLLKKVNDLAQKEGLPDVSITEKGVKISPLVAGVPKEVEALRRRLYNQLPRIRITDLLLEVDSWTGFTKHFNHLKTGEAVGETSLLLTAILSDAINLGLTKMAESCPEATFSKLSWIQAWFIRDETYSSALAELVNAQLQDPLALLWGEGTTSSSDGQRYRTGSYAREGGNVNPKYGSEPGVQFYTHVSDQYTPFYTKVINVGVRDATYVLDGLLYHETDLRIDEHYTDTSGFTDHVFALMSLLGFRFAPRIRDINDKKIYSPDSRQDYSNLNALIGGKINVNLIRSNWEDIARLVSSIDQGVVTASLIIRKIGSYPRQNGLAVALRELGKIERSIFMLNWFMDPELRRRVTAGLNKGEARNTLARVVFMHRLGEIRENSFENQQNRASGLTNVTASITRWNTVYLNKAKKVFTDHGEPPDENLLKHVSPLGWEHINFAGDYTWNKNKQPKKGKLRPLRPFL